MAALDVQYIEEEDDVSTTSTEWQDNATLTWTPNATKNYIIIISAEMYNITTSNNTVLVRVLLDDVEMGYTYNYNEGEDYWLHFGFTLYEELDNTEHTLKSNMRKKTQYPRRSVHMVIGRTTMYLTLQRVLT